MKRFLIILTFTIMFPWALSAYKPDNNSVYHSHQNYRANLSSDTIKNALIDIKPFNLEIIAPSSGVQFYRGGILFLSYSKNAEKMIPKHLSFGSIGTYYAAVNDTVPGEFRSFAPDLSFNYPIDAVAFSRDFNTMYFTKISPADNKEKIFSASYSQTGWNADENPLNFCNDKFIYTHPALSDDGSFMIFSSDKTGSFGGLDLYLTLKDNDTWSEPENLGKTINTSGNELFASLDAHNNLYFSSDGLPGLGGYDIFVCPYNGKGWDKPENLTGIVNSRNDEVAFTLNRYDGKSAFYTSRLRNAKGKLQLYRVTFNGAGTTTTNNELSEQFLAEAGLDKKPFQMKPDTPIPLAMNEPAKTETKTEPVPKEVINRPVEEKAIPAESKKEIKTIENKTVPDTIPDKRTVSEPVVQQPVEPKSERQTAPAKVEKTDIILYRVQILANMKPAGSYKLTIANKIYTTFEYFYMGGYRTTVGEFTSLAEATKFQNLCRQLGYNQAFVVAFKNNIRSTDPSLFKR